ncbi:TPA: hypothetical protein ROD35_001110 [Campylobacter coli]|nr:hypothetical protein [Campylobacter coli]
MIFVNYENLLDLKYLASRIFDPLEGFMNYEDFKSVVYDMKLSNGVIWTLPITLEVEDLNSYAVGSIRDLYYQNELIRKYIYRINFKYKIKIYLKFIKLKI